MLAPSTLRGLGIKPHSTSGAALFYCAFFPWGVVQVHNPILYRTKALHNYSIVGKVRVRHREHSPKQKRGKLKEEERMRRENDEHLMIVLYCCRFLSQQLYSLAKKASKKYSKKGTKLVNFHHSNRSNFGSFFDLDGFFWMVFPEGDKGGISKSRPT